MSMFFQYLISTALCALMVIIIFHLTKEKNRKSWKQLFQQIREDEAKMFKSDKNTDPVVVLGKYTEAEIYATLIENEALEQIKTLCDAPFVEGEKIAIMPDAHAGTGCVIGYTQTIGNKKVCPSLVGVDLFCGMLTVKLGKLDVNLPRFDDVVHEKIPAGMSVHENRIVHFSRLQELKCYHKLKDTKRLECSIGSLGGGNHFIELDRASDGTVYLVIHTGSRNLGKQIAEYWQKHADEIVNHNMDEYYRQRDKIIATYKAEGRRSEIQTALKNLKAEYQKQNLNVVDKDLAWLEGQDSEDYLHDCRIAGEFAHLNRMTIADQIIKGYFGKEYSINNFEYFETIHNYIDLNDMMIRKGAISAHKGEKVIIPISMKDGALICIGKGNPNYNMSAPHGAGRRMGRRVADETLSVDEFKRQMEGIYSTSVNKTTLDESPMAYKGLDDILPMLEATCTVLEHIKPIYSFKAGDEKPWLKNK